MGRAGPRQIFQSVSTTNVNREDLLWLSPAIIAGLLIGVYYFIEFDKPFAVGGLFWKMAQGIQIHGFRLPATIPDYGNQNIPFAYPPLMFYLMASYLELGGDPFVITKFVPPLVSAAAAIPIFFITKNLVRSRHVAALAAVISTTTPGIIFYHFEGTGLVRGPAFFLSLCGIYAGIRMLETHEWQWFGVTTLLFTLTGLAHPVYPVFFALSLAVLWTCLDRTKFGFLLSIAVGILGLIFTAPWWTLVAQRHGLDVFFAASETHGGLFNTLYYLRDYPGSSTPPGPFAVWNYWLWYGAFIGIAFEIYKRRFVVSTWFFATLLVHGQPRFVYLTAAILTGMWVFPATRLVVSYVETGLLQIDFSRIAFVMIIIIAAFGTLGTISFVDPLSEYTLQEEDLQAGEWIQSNERVIELFTHYSQSDYCYNRLLA